MNYSFRTACLMILLVLPVLSGCAPGQASRSITLIFDGESCRYEGPGTLTPGDVTVSLRNESNYDASLWVVGLNEGKTWQDMLDFIGKPGSNVHPPDWSFPDIIKELISTNPHVIQYSFKRGLYALCCCTCNEITGPRGVWPGGALEVKDK